MKAIVIGATGATGKELVKHLLETDWITEVTALVARKKLKEHIKLRQKLVDFDHLDKYEHLIKGDIAFSCMGTTLKRAGSKEAQWKVDYDYQYEFAKWAKENGVPVFVLLSAMNANSSAKVFYAQMKGQLEEKIQDLEFDRLNIIRPSLLIRPNSDRTMEKIGVSLFRGLNALGLAQQYTPIKVEKVARAMVESINRYTQTVNKVGVQDILQITEGL